MASERDFSQAGGEQERIGRVSRSHVGIGESSGQVSALTCFLTACAKVLTTYIPNSSPPDHVLFPLFRGIELISVSKRDCHIHERRQGEIPSITLQTVDWNRFLQHLKTRHNTFKVLSERANGNI